MAGWWLKPVGAALALAIAVAAPSFAHDNEIPDGATALASSQAAIGAAIGDWRFIDSRGKPLRLNELRGRPLVISLIYTSCVHTCPMITQRLADVADVAREALGQDSFAIATIGFDSRADNPARMAAFASQQGIDDPNWLFLAADHATIDGLTRDLGFSYARSAADGFEHITQTTVLDAEGRVYRQIYGQGFDAPALVEPLKDLVLGRNASFTSVEGWINRVKLFCTIYNPASERYRFDYSLFVGLVIGFLSLSAVGTVVVRGWWRLWKQRQTA